MFFKRLLARNKGTPMRLSATALACHVVGSDDIVVRPYLPTCKDRDSNDVNHGYSADYGRWQRFWHS